MKHLAIIALALLVPDLASAGAVPGGNDVLYGASKGSHDAGPAPSTFYRIDPATAVVEAVGPIGFTSVTGMTFHSDGRLLATAYDSVDNAAILIEIDPTTGAGALIGEISDGDDAGGCGHMPGLAWDPGTSQLFGWGDNCDGGNDRFFVIDPDTGAGGVPIDPSEDGCGNALAVRPDTGLLYSTACAAGGENLYTVDKATGALTLVPGSEAPNVVLIQGGADFRPNPSLLYSLYHDGSMLESYLVYIDVSSSVPTQNVVGRLRDAGDVPVDGFDALAFGKLAPGECPAAPSVFCQGPEKEKGAKLVLKDKGEKVSFSLKKVNDGNLAQFGDPTVDTGYTLCLYDGDTEIGRYYVPGGATGWKAKKNGFKYKAKDGPDDIRKIKLKANKDITGNFAVKGKDVTLPGMPLAQSPAVTAQLHNVLGYCWDATFLPENTKKNDEKQFKAKGQ